VGIEGLMAAMRTDVPRVRSLAVERTAANQPISRRNRRAWR
jgi:hypothetical protein